MFVSFDNSFSLFVDLLVACWYGHGFLAGQEIMLPAVAGLPLADRVETEQGAIDLSEYLPISNCLLHPLMTSAFFLKKKKRLHCHYISSAVGDTVIRRWVESEKALVKNKLL